MHMLTSSQHIVQWAHPICSHSHSCFEEASFSAIYCKFFNSSDVHYAIPTRRLYGIYYDMSMIGVYILSNKILQEKLGFDRKLTFSVTNYNTLLRYK